MHKSSPTFRYKTKLKDFEELLPLAPGANRARYVTNDTCQRRYQHGRALVAETVRQRTLSAARPARKHAQTDRSKLASRTQASCRSTSQTNRSIVSSAVVFSATATALCHLSKRRCCFPNN